MFSLPITPWVFFDYITFRFMVSQVDNFRSMNVDLIVGSAVEPPEYPLCPSESVDQGILHCGNVNKCKPSLFST